MPEQARRRVPPPALFGLAWSAQSILTRKKKASASSRTAFGVLAAASGALALSAIGTLVSAGTQLGPEHPERSSALTTNGPFQLTRNPIYLAMAGLLVGHALLRRSLFALAPAAGFVAVLNRDQIPAEERALGARFGRSYKQYRDSTPRWLGAHR